MQYLLSLEGEWTGGWASSEHQTVKHLMSVSALVCSPSISHLAHTHTHRHTQRDSTPIKILQMKQKAAEFNGLIASHFSPCALIVFAFCFWVRESFLSLSLSLFLSHASLRPQLCYSSFLYIHESCQWFPWCAKYIPRPWESLPH